jgi:hypothetical protein
MKDPARWRDPHGGADAETRALLLGDQAPTPSSAEVDRVWSTLAPQLRVVPAPTHAAPAGPTAAAGMGALVGKIALGVVLVAAVGAGVGLRGRYSRDRKSDSVRHEQAKAMPPAISLPASGPTMVEPAQPEVAPTGLAPAAERAARPKSRSTWPSPSVAKSPAAHPVALATAPSVASQPSTNALLEESRRLARARAALRAHDPDRALALLETGVPGTAALAQEREALTIEALVGKRASRAVAAERARAFMRAYPESPYRARIKAIVFENQ